MNTKTFKVLVADDEPYMRELLREYLEPEGYIVETAEDGAVAWDKLNASPDQFDVLVTDRNMPNMNGLQLLSNVKHDARFESLPVIFQTAYAAREEMVEGLRAGVYYYLAKPYERQVLVALVSSAIEEKQRIRRLREEVTHHDKAYALLHQGEFRCRTLAEVHQLTALLGQLSCNPGRVVGGLSELLLNALEHGNLGIKYAEKGELVMAGQWQQEVEKRQQLPEFRDKYVSVALLRDPAQTIFTITDQGEGFDVSKYLTFDPDRAVDVHGRGIAMARMMSFDSVEYLGRGNQVIAVVRG